MSRKSRPLTSYETLLLSCATPFSDDRTHRAVAAAARADLDWPMTARLALRHGIAPCLAIHLRRLSAEYRPPEAVSACFERMYRANALRNRVLFREAARLQRAFTEAGIPCLLLKGVALALTAYPDSALRNFADIDLLVAPKDYAAAGKVAEACGFQCSFPEAIPYTVHQPYVLFCPEDILTETLPLEFDPDISRSLVAANRHLILIEIHRGLFHDANGMAYQAAAETLWEAMQAAHFPDGTPFYCPSPAVMLFHLAAHAADHSFGRLMYFMDMAAAVRHWDGAIDWDRLMTLSVEHEVSGHIYRSLELAHRAFGAAVPYKTLDRLASTQGRRAARLMLSLPTIMTVPLQDPQIGFIKRVLFSPNARQFFQSLQSTLAPPPMVMRRIYGVRHPALIALFYLLRPFLLVGRVIGLLLRRIRPRRRQRKTTGKTTK
jgi:hypothetical protein